MFTFFGIFDVDSEMQTQTCFCSVLSRLIRCLFAFKSKINMTKCDSDYVFIATTMTTITTMTSYGVCDADDANFHFGFVVNFMAIRRAMTFAFEERVHRGVDHVALKGPSVHGPQNSSVSSPTQLLELPRGNAPLPKRPFIRLPAGSQRLDSDHVKR